MIRIHDTPVRASIPYFKSSKLPPLSRRSRRHTRYMTRWIEVAPLPQQFDYLSTCFPNVVHLRVVIIQGQRCPVSPHPQPLVVHSSVRRHVSFFASFCTEQMFCMIAGRVGMSR